MGQTIQRRRVRRGAAQYWRGQARGGGMSKTELRELGRAAADGARITVLPPGKKPPN
jgi:hypothetical protein